MLLLSWTMVFAEFLEDVAKKDKTAENIYEIYKKAKMVNKLCTKVAGLINQSFQTYRADVLQKLQEILKCCHIQGDQDSNY